MKPNQAGILYDRALTVLFEHVIERLDWHSAVRSECPLRAADIDRRPSQDLGILFARLYFGAPIDRPRTAQPVAADVSYRLSLPKRLRLQLYSP